MICVFSGETGSYRYMAPEVFMHEPYNTSVDVYSFAMICYQLFESRVPFEGTDAVHAAKQAALHQTRPSFSPLLPNSAHKEAREVRAQLSEMPVLALRQACYLW
jgi:serine/threonine protein kinase